MMPTRPAPRVAALMTVALGLLSACAELDPYALSRSSGQDGGSRGTTPPTGSEPARKAPADPGGGLPAAVRPPADARERLRTQAIGDITYECRRHLIEPTRFVWSFVVPAATLFDANQKPVGRYYAGPTWEGNDKSKVTGRQIGSAPVSATDLPLQLIRADVSTGNGIMKGVTYIQRLNTRGGLPSGPCDSSLAGRRQQVKFQADYLFY